LSSRTLDSQVYWNIEKKINAEILKEERAKYGGKIIVTIRHNQLADVVWLFD
jgi:hypothetical protein